MIAVAASVAASVALVGAAIAVAVSVAAAAALVGTAIAVTAAFLQWLRQ